MLLGPERWKESMDDSDRIRLTLLGEAIRWTREEMDEEEDQEETSAGFLDPLKMKIKSFN